MPQVPKFELPPLPSQIDPVGKRIAQIRKAQGLTQQALADKIGISRKLITDYETGRVRLNDEMIIRISIALETSADTILGMTPMDLASEVPSLRFTRRIRELDQLPEAKKKGHP